MRCIQGAAKLAAAATAFAVLLLAAPAGAVIDGTSDTANRYANVGVLQLNVEGEWFDFCSGTLVRADVVLTAAHCTDFLVEEGPDGFGPDDLRISFDPEGDAPFSTVDHIVVHPDWPTAGPCFGNSKHACLAPPAEDIALVFLDESVVGVTPAPIAEEGYLDTLDLKNETFTVVGYGTDESSPVAPHRRRRSPSCTAGVCFGDSGGPLFHGETIVALNTWTFSYRCDGPNLEYRVDSAVAQEFLATYL